MLPNPIKGTDQFQFVMKEQELERIKLLLPPGISIVQLPFPQEYKHLPDLKKMLLDRYRAYEDMVLKKPKGLFSRLYWTLELVTEVEEFRPLFELSSLPHKHHALENDIPTFDLGVIRQSLFYDEYTNYESFYQDVQFAYKYAQENINHEQTLKAFEKCISLIKRLLSDMKFYIFEAKALKNKRNFGKKREKNQKNEQIKPKEKRQKSGKKAHFQNNSEDWDYSPIEREQLRKEVTKLPADSLRNLFTLLDDNPISEESDGDFDFQACSRETIDLIKKFLADLKKLNSIPRINGRFRKPKNFLYNPRQNGPKPTKRKKLREPDNINNEEIFQDTSEKENIDNFEDSEDSFEKRINESEDSSKEGDKH